MIELKRVFDAPSPNDGFRVLVDRFWPRDLTEKHAKLDLWLQEVAPSVKLHEDFGDSPAPQRWPQFEKLYRAELQNKRKAVAMLQHKASEGLLTLLHGAHDSDRNGAAVPKRFLEEAGSQGKQARPP